MWTLRTRTVTRWTKNRRGGGYEPIVTSMNDDLFNSLRLQDQNQKHEQWIFLNEETGDRFRNRHKRRSQPLWTSSVRDPGLIIVHPGALDHEDDVKSDHYLLMVSKLQ